MSGRRIALCVTGSIAAYKAAALLRLLQKAGASVEVVLSRAAHEFVGPATFQGLNAKPPLGELFDRAHAGELHIDVAKNSDAIVIAPASADCLSRLAAGRADDLIAAIALSARCPVLVAPAMHPNMWSHPATERNVATLRRDGVQFIGPVDGEVASGDRGLGRMAEPEQIVLELSGLFSSGNLSGRRLVVSAGPTLEALDPVRALTNRSSGKFGFAIAERARARGAEVTLICGPVALSTPPGVHRVDVESALSLQGALWEALGPDLSKADALIMAAAVADYRPKLASESKLKRSGPLSIDLEPNPDLLAEIGARRTASRPVLIGFALETDTDERIVASARDKLAKKRVDLVVANHAAESIGRDDVRITLVGPDTASAFGPTPKLEAAEHLLDWLVERLAQ